MNEQWIDLSAIVPALKFAQEELREQESHFKPATQEQLIGLVCLMRSRGYRAAFKPTR